jgi:hypothetical protein
VLSLSNKIKRSLDEFIGQDQVFTDEDKKAIQLRIREKKEERKRVSFRFILNGILLASVLPALLFLAWITLYDHPTSENSGQYVGDSNKYYTHHLGEYVWNATSKKLFFGEAIATPSSVDFEKISDEMEVITVPITFESTFSGTESINPYIFKIVSDSGEERKLYHMEVIENDGWRSGVMKAGGGKVTFAVTYVYPKNKEDWHIEFIDWNFRGSFEKVNIVKLTE